MQTAITETLASDKASRDVGAVLNVGETADATKAQYVIGKQCDRC